MASTTLSEFPFLTAAEFDHACRAFLTRLHAFGGPEALGWSSARHIHPAEVSIQPSPGILRISKTVTPGPNQHNTIGHTLVDEDTESLDDTIQDEDHETLIRDASHDKKAQLVIDYDIAFSETYQVPVMYFVVPGIHQTSLAAIDAVYQLLVPDRHRQPLKSSGVMGGISFGYHPQSGIPAYFIHPCNTATAMRDIAGDRGVEPETYLLIWLGLVGNCIGLNLPSHMFMQNSAHKT
ncbi:uncharacterized protein TRUGW13939_09788 [Talaromyces rugulosus]|uniref:Ubiquitin-like-conjugating enzyme ATG10 n=1 Tax=Talaromyces rugulosus TaxID=121627 RepID=A0A7H8R935_TALRU|nr:uncharacterized protein TRUGW13939_09788 [Talaromyces rugulosus]QKX62627.1 hypothetical protein TRUGW13939_09788 [Talaromyces rugulosus]